MPRKNHFLCLLSMLAPLALVGCGGSSNHGNSNYGSVSATNDVGYCVYDLYTSPSGAANWGANQLGNSWIVPGDTFTLIDVPVGYYDLRAELYYCDTTGYFATAYLYNFYVQDGQTTNLYITY